VALLIPDSSSFFRLSRFNNPLHPKNLLQQQFKLRKTTISTRGHSIFPQHSKVAPPALPKQNKYNPLQPSPLKRKLERLPRHQLNKR